MVANSSLPANNLSSLLPGKKTLKSFGKSAKSGSPKPCKEVEKMRADQQPFQASHGWHFGGHSPPATKATAAQQHRPATSCPTPRSSRLSSLISPNSQPRMLSAFRFPL